MLFNSSTPTLQAGQLHFISKDISLEQITKVQSFAPELLADKWTQGKLHMHQWVTAELNMLGCPTLCQGFLRCAGLLPRVEA